MYKIIVHYFWSSRRRELPFVIFLSFLITFIGSRLIVLLILNSWLPEWLMLNFGGVHVHHLTYGIFLLTIAGFWALMDNERHYSYKIALIYGVGLALAFDEFGMWLHLEDDYWMRTSFDAIIVLTAMFINIIYLKVFWTRIGKVMQHIYRKLSLPDKASEK